MAEIVAAGAPGSEAEREALAARLPLAALGEHRPRGDGARARLAVVPGDFGWSDLGSWQSAWELAGKDADGNAVPGGDDVRGRARQPGGRPARGARRRAG